MSHEWIFNTFEQDSPQYINCSLNGFRKIFGLILINMGKNHRTQNVTRACEMLSWLPNFWDVNLKSNILFYIARKELDDIFVIFEEG